MVNFHPASFTLPPASAQSTASFLHLLLGYKIMLRPLGIYIGWLGYAAGMLEAARHPENMVNMLSNYKPNSPDPKTPYIQAAPSIPRTFPLIHSPSWLARKQTTLAMSMGRPTLCKGLHVAAYCSILVGRATLRKQISSYLVNLIIAQVFAVRNILSAYCVVHIRLDSAWGNAVDCDSFVAEV